MECRHCSYSKYIQDEQLLACGYVCKIDNTSTGILGECNKEKFYNSLQENGFSERCKMIRKWRNEHCF